MNSDKIFNPKALEKLRSPDKLDSMIRITGPVGWMGLATVALLCFAIVLWSVYGSFTEKAEGYGLILDSAGVVNISHTVSGKVTSGRPYGTAGAIGRYAHGTIRYRTGRQ